MAEEIKVLVADDSLDESIVEWAVAAVGGQDRLDGTRARGIAGRRDARAAA